MPRTYQKKFLDDGTLNPAWIPRSGANARSGKSGKSGKKLPLFEIGKFIALDGEGADINDVHRYVMLMNSYGNTAISENGLPTVTCLDFLLETANTARRNNDKGIFVIFGGNYDFNFWLRDIPKSIIEKIVEADGQYFTWWNDYAIKMIQRKFFVVERGGVSIKVWDVHGFFQGSFIGAIKQWLPGYEGTDLIIEGKARRSQFSMDELDFIKRYTTAELDALCKMMDKLRDGIRGLGLTIGSWHGAGAIATAMLKHHKTKEIYDELPQEVYEGAKYAYFGGRIELGKYGRHNGKIYHYDINSAYPAVQATLPALKGGKWIKHGKGFDPRKSDNELILCLVQWDNLQNTRFCPFPFRSWAQLKVLYPTCGMNYLWKPEIAAALDVRDEQSRDYWEINILEAYEFIPANPDYKPFAWIQEYYDERQKIVAESKRSGIPNGAEKAIKLGINSLYGKQAQRIGYDEKTGRKPPYFNLAYAGHITAATRAKLWRAAMQNDDAIICLATDGIYSTAPLNLDCPKEKILGKWEAQEHDEMIMVQSGFYFLRNGDQWDSYSRGFDRMTTQAEMIETMNVIMDTWKKRRGEVWLPCTRFITLKSALCGGGWWERWLTWHKFYDEKAEQPGRRLAITCTGTKRTADSDRLPNRGMIPTLPTFNFTGPHQLGDQHDIPWDVEEIEHGVKNMEILIEHFDGLI